MCTLRVIINFILLVEVRPSSFIATQASVILFYRSTCINHSFVTGAYRWPSSIAASYWSFWLTIVLRPPKQATKSTTKLTNGTCRMSIQFLPIRYTREQLRGTWISSSSLHGVGLQPVPSSLLPSLPGRRPTHRSCANSFVVYSALY